MQKLQDYAKFLAKIRQFFLQNNVIEVSTESLLIWPTSDANIDSIIVKTNAKFIQKTYYLHTSPELEMKKLLANGSGDIYQICKVYRDNEIGERNFNEFSMLEYYRLGFDEQNLSKDVVKLLNFVGIFGDITIFSYQDIFIKFANFNINSSFNELKKIAKKHNLVTDFDNIADLQTLLFVHFIEKKLKQFPICIINDYPASQSALAKVEDGFAKRFEIYLNGIEVANGYKELTKMNDYKQRFLEQSSNKEERLDTQFLDTLANPIPDCAGVAIGLDRVFNLYGYNDIQ